MENKLKLILFISFVGFMIFGLLVEIPTFINNIIYAAMAIIAIFFLIVNRENLGLSNMFKKQEEDKK